MTQPTFTPMQTALVAILPKRGGAVTAVALATAAGISVPTVHAELRPLIDVEVVGYDAANDQYGLIGGAA